MQIDNEILSNLNFRYVLLKKDLEYLIIDKIRRSLVIIDNPIINVEALIKLMLENRVEIYDNIKNLPAPTEHSLRSNSKPTSFKIFMKKMFNERNKETGVIISAIAEYAINEQSKKRIEKRMENYAFSVLYPGEGLNVYSNTYNDTASIIVVKNINNLPAKEIGDTELEIYQW